MTKQERLERRIVADIIQIAFAYDEFWTSDECRLDDNWSDHINELRNNILDWAMEYEEEAVYHVDEHPIGAYHNAIGDFASRKFEEQEWTRPDFTDPATIKAIAKDARFGWCQKYDQIIRGKREGWIEVMTPDEYVESQREECGQVWDDLDYYYNVGASNWDELLKELNTGRRHTMGVGNTRSGMYRGEPYVIIIVE